MRRMRLEVPAAERAADLGEQPTTPASKSPSASHVYGNVAVIGFKLFLRFTFRGDSDHKGSTSKVVEEQITA